MKRRSYVTALAMLTAAPTAWAAMNIQPDPENPTGYIISRADVEAVEQQKTADPMYQIWSQALRTAPNTLVEAIEPGSVSNPDNVKRAEKVFPEAEWDFLTHMAAPEYTYTRFLRAIGKFPAFCAEYTDGRDSDAICKRSIVTAFAHFAQETGGHISIGNVSDNPLALEEWQQALVHVREMGWSEGQAGYTTGCGQNDWQNKKWPCAAGQGYFGRGAKQLSYHFNYGAFSEVMFDGDATVLLNNPGLVADSWLNLASAIWFFLTPQAPKPAMLHVIDRTWVPSQREIDAGIGYGFGTTINIINGGIECGAQNKDKGQPVNRIRYWEGLSEHYQIPIEADEQNTCWQQTPYGSLNLNGATDVLYTNWDGNWKYYSDRPGGYSFECELVGFQTAYSALVPGDYEKCVTNLYESHSSWPEVRVVDELVVVDPVEPPVDGVAAWDASKVYTGGEQVSYSGAVYEAKWWSQGNEPTAGDPWKLVSGTPTTEPETPITEPETPVTEPETPVTEPETPVTEPEQPVSSDFITWEPGVTQVANGDKVTYQGKCFVAKNGPGTWETPRQSNWFWDEISCQ
ncbi:chitinase [Vibrio sp. B1FLJ16]|uniref:chitinase n=1 Tax=Vibrio sp. B1FLJ16 TaxID=2751178 RepID=UPI0015F41BD6|nr:glycoside hydrolase family 19 protein [Vibrio sp. B1FLJ16]CAD7800175.1 protein contain chitin-binding domain type 3 [Vibrio sp. B1FLJ16]CAD7800193.1 protein contain chitin-binding domain type 3 [Vibrio sp. B1FLJ16]CAE6887107.1 protein contain chitin-binding domain type 3 [Vibrio sp. B1FLJ16]CAE6888002.1 protein contain chitin-binding domain type 3 [Vibrio sp. B1FLJ16]